MKEQQRRKIRLAGKILLIMYVFLLIYFLFLAEWYGRKPDVNVEPRYNLVPFFEIRRYIRNRQILGMEIVILNLMGNVIGFVPFGFLLPVVFPKMKKRWIVVSSGMLISITVEILQLYLRVGSCDVDDVILNTAGTAVGFVCYHICNSLRRKYYGKKNKI